jgi:hypothetical protein
MDAGPAALAAPQYHIAGRALRVERRGHRGRVQPIRRPGRGREGAVAARKWSDLSKRNQRLLIAAAAAEASLKAAALIDLKRRPASEIRGSKWLWIPAVTVINCFGCAPLAYFIFGRRR